ncbi:MAG: hypothetical protein RIQ79_1159 [Verrucomicrobiota bacterium]
MHPFPTLPRSCRRLLRLAVVWFAIGGSVFAETTAENTAAVVAAANTFLATLTASQRVAIDSTADVAGGNNSSVLYNFTLTNAEIWSNLPTSMVTRNGLRFAELSTTQLNAALAIASAAVSSTGTTLMEEIRLADQYIAGEVTNSKGTTSSMWGYKKYYIAFVGPPSTTSPWALQIGGHHLAYNLTYNGTYLSCTPMFAATEPNSWTYSGTTHAPLGTQRSLILSLRSTLTTSALLSGTFSDVVFGPNGTGSHDTNQPKSYPTSGRGQLYSSLTTTQQGYVRSYIQSWVNNHAGPRASELLAIYMSDQALAETYVGYAGSSTTLAANGNYFRVDGPRLWIEFVVQGGVWDSSGVHDHAVWRDKLADYGAAYGSTTISTTLRPPTLSTSPASQTVTVGGAATFSVVAASAGTGTATLSYQWYKGTAVISGATAASYTINPITAGSAGDYSVRVISTGGLVTSSAATLTVNTIAAPAITTPPASVAASVGADVSFTVVASGGGTLTYQWYKGTAAIDGASSATYAISAAPAAAAGSYHVVVTNSAGSATSADVTLTLTEPYAAFLAAHGLTGTTDSTDSDGDGVANLLEFVVGGDPVTAETGLEPVAAYDALAASPALVLSFYVNTSLGSVTYAVEYTPDLATWTTAVAGENNITTSVTAFSAGKNLVVYTIPTTAERLFARVRASTP